eukprot:TRINITY_DN59381_c0_g1_i5.p1 TRINITY_DN59381_c0_g1~~TRINITY_DN59381_c0_g1_i5.p1  ORF type:complete len:126 (+),score=0.58 TRINITY_DN59381_c0_g1_i5:221-598(+)
MYYAISPQVLVTVTTSRQHIIMREIVFAKIQQLLWVFYIVNGILNYFSSLVILLQIRLRYILRLLLQRVVGTQMGNHLLFGTRKSQLFEDFWNLQCQKLDDQYKQDEVYCCKQVQAFLGNLLMRK